VKAVKDKTDVTPPVVVSSEVARGIRQHARSNMKTEVCGVLIGGVKNGALHIDECIAGKDAAQAGTHVTFTQDTWEHIYKVKDADFPDERIVGWYHSHPGFGIFLSDHDTFIHRNFFSAPEQVAWVYDPHSDEEGFFGWAGERIERLALVTIADSRGGEECSEHHGSQDSAAHDDDGKPQPDLPRQLPVTRKSALRWVVTLLTHLLAIALGLLIAWYIFPRVLVVPVDPQTGKPLIDLPAGIIPDHPAPPAGAPPANNAPHASHPPDQGSKGNNAQPK
jgi:proteasome lid subunit RPN8/RPN11